VKAPATRRLLGLAALGCLVTGAILFFQGGEANSSVFIRAGLVLAAVWFAWPLVIKVDRRWLAPVAIGVVVAITRPLMLVWLLPLLIALGLLRRRPVPPPRRPR
jgi:hypothetical protein